MSFSDIFKSSYLENVNSVSLVDMVLALVLAFGVGSFGPGSDSGGGFSMPGSGGGFSMPSSEGGGFSMPGSEGGSFTMPGSESGAAGTETDASLPSDTGDGERPSMPSGFTPGDMSGMSFGAQSQSVQIAWPLLNASLAVLALGLLAAWRCRRR